MVRADFPSQLLRGGQFGWRNFQKGRRTCSTSYPFWISIQATRMRCGIKYNYLIYPAGAVHWRGLPNGAVARGRGARLIANPLTILSEEG
jgi:hypothetical protein